MTFQVKPDTLTSYGSLIERNGLNFSLVNVCLAQHANLGSTAGLWLQMLVGAHNDTTARMSDSIYRGFHAMGDSADELTRTAEYYRTTDQNSAADLDATYPASHRPVIKSPSTYRPPGMEGKQGPVTGGAGTDVQDPLPSLKAPAQPAEFTDPLKFFNAVDDLLSPSWWINQVLNDTIGVNPLDAVTNVLIGDWEGFARCALVWKNLSWATGAIAENVKSGLTRVAADWQGQAADAAVHYFDYLRQALDSHRDVLQRLHEKYLEVARGVWNAARALADLLKDMLDNLIVAGLMVLAAALTSWTGVGPGISLMVAGYQCKRIIDLWGDATRLITGTQTVVEGFVGFLQSQEAHVLDEIKPVAMPATNYDHPNPDIKPATAGPRTKEETL